MKKKLTICLVSDTVYDLNGVSRFIQDFSKEALKFNKNFYVITSTNKNHYEEIPNIFNIKPILSMKMPFYKSLELVFPNFFKIKRKIKEINPDILYISTPGTVGLSALISAKILKIPVLGIYHTDFPSYLYKNTNSQFIKWGTIQFLRIFYSSFKALFLRSEDSISIIKEQLKFIDNELFILEAGINIDNFNITYKDDSIWEKYNVNQKNFKVLYVGRISIEKNIDKLINIWQKILPKECELILVGDIELKIDKTYLNTKNIKFIERKQKEELSKIYASSDCFIFPSTTDTLGQVVMEAMASGLPVIVTDKGGPQTFVKNNFGYIVDFDSLSNINNAIISLSKKDKEYYIKKENAYNFMKDKSISSSFLKFFKENEEIYKNFNK